MGSTGSRTLPKDKRIVIVGAGYGGALLGGVLLKMHANMTIIDVKDSFYHNIGAVRAVTEPGYV